MVTPVTCTGTLLIVLAAPTPIDPRSPAPTLHPSAQRRRAAETVATAERECCVQARATGTGVPELIVSLLPNSPLFPYPQNQNRSVGPYGARMLASGRHGDRIDATTVDKSVGARVPFPS